jgi:LmbE family N-acetylglucosaminyl deacetylase
MKILCVHAHYDDFEFVASGTFELWRQKLGPSLRARVLVCTDGAGGHHRLTREETARVRLAEQQASARLGGYEFELLRLPDGQVPREAALHQVPAMLPALWKAIRDFEPDYLFAPPVVTDPLAGVHVDHANVAELVRKVAYLINVPHAFTPEYPADETCGKPCRTPVILTVHDSYMAGTNRHDLAVDIEPVFDQVARLAWCHQSQLREWLPWVGRHQMAAPESFAQWQAVLRARCRRRNQEVGIRSPHAHEVFTVTAWGEIPPWAQLRRDLPGLSVRQSRLRPLQARLRKWRAA